MVTNTFGDEHYKLTQSYSDIMHPKEKEETKKDTVEDIKQRQNEALKRLARRWKR